MHAVIFVALSDVRPIGDIQDAMWSKVKFDTAEPRVGSLHKVFRVFTDEGRSFSHESVAVDSLAVQVDRQNRVVVLLSPGTAGRDDDHARVRVSAAGLVSGFRDSELTNVRRTSQPARLRSH